MSKPLVTAARCALADMIGQFENDAYEGNDAPKQTIVDLYNALKDEGEDVSDYAEQVENVKESME